jgi:hypothetical protein
MSGICSGKKWDRRKLIQNLVSGATGLLVAADVMSLRVPLYFFGQATDGMGEVFHSVAKLVRHGLSDIFDQIETGSITLSDTLYLVWTAILIGTGFVFLRRAWRALATMRPGRWLRAPRLGWRGMILAVLAFGGAIALVCQYGDVSWLAGRLADSLWLAVKAAYANRDALWQAVLAIDESKETIGQVAKGTLGAVATSVTLKFAWVAVDFARSIIGVALPIMLLAARYGYHGYKHAREWLPRVELTPCKIDWLHGAGSLAAGSIFGFESLSLPSIPTLLWAGSVPGLFLFLRTRPHLLRRAWRIGYYVGRYLKHCVSIATEYAHSHPTAARSISAGAMVAVAALGTLHAFSLLFAVAIVSGTLKAAYSAVQIALMIAAVRGTVKMAANVRRAGRAVIRHGDATKQKLISASGQLNATGANAAQAARRLVLRTRLPRAQENLLGYSPARLRLRPMRRVERAMVFRPVVAVSNERLHG